MIRFTDTAPNVLYSVPTSGLPNGDMAKSCLADYTSPSTPNFEDTAPPNIKLAGNLDTSTSANQNNNSLPSKSKSGDYAKNNEVRQGRLENVIRGPSNRILTKSSDLTEQKLSATVSVATADNQSMNDEYLRKRSLNQEYMTLGLKSTLDLPKPEIYCNEISTGNLSINNAHLSSYQNMNEQPQEPNKTFKTYPSRKAQVLKRITRARHNMVKAPALRELHRNTQKVLEETYGIKISQEMYAQARHRRKKTADDRYKTRRQALPHIQIRQSPQQIERFMLQTLAEPRGWSGVSKSMVKAIWHRDYHQRSDKPCEPSPPSNTYNRFFEELDDDKIFLNAPPSLNKKGILCGVE